MEMMMMKWNLTLIEIRHCATSAMNFLILCFIVICTICIFFLHN